MKRKNRKFPNFRSIKAACCPLEGSPPSIWQKIFVGDGGGGQKRVKTSKNHKETQPGDERHGGRSSDKPVDPQEEERRTNLEDSNDGVAELFEDCCLDLGFHDK